MLKADLAIGAGGATSWERCCLGLPSLIITMAENQKPIAAELDRQRLAHWLGDHDTVNEFSLTTALKDALDSKGMADWSNRCRNTVDAKGTERVAAIVSLTSSTQLKARPACVDDEDLLLQWAKNPLVRQNVFNRKVISPEENRDWFYKRLRDPDNCRIYVVKTVEGLPIGQVRFELTDDSWEIDFALDPVARDKGLGKNLLQAAIKVFRQSMSGGLVFGRVKKGNVVSQEVFEDFAFTPEEEKGEESKAIAICSDSDSWMNEYIPGLLLGWLVTGHQCVWVHSSADLPGGALCFYLSYGRIVDQLTCEKYKNNLVIHASDLPSGRGWSPTSWMILEGKQSIPVTLLEVVKNVDSGPIYAQEWIELKSTSLTDQWRAELADATLRLATDFVSRFPESLNSAHCQEGEATYYAKRCPKDSELDIDKTLRDQFNLLRIVDNDNYPAYFLYTGKKFVLQIREEDSE